MVWHFSFPVGFKSKGYSAEMHHGGNGPQVPEGSSFERYLDSFTVGKLISAHRASKETE